MYDTSGPYSICDAAPVDVAGTARRVDWLKGELARQEPVRTAPSVSEEWRALRSVTLGKGLTAAEAYAWFGTFLGLFPPLAIFARILGAIHSGGRPEATEMFLLWGFLFLIMNAVCCWAGSVAGGLVGRMSGEPGGRGLWSHLSWSLLMAFVWGILTGAAGGAVAFLTGLFLGAGAGFIALFVGAACGAFCAVAVAAVSFPLFALHHRDHSHGGMIEARRLWPLACGIPLTAAALILNW